jgi:hypothetical protein
MQTQTDTHRIAAIEAPSLGEFLKKTRLSQRSENGRPLTISDIKRRSGKDPRPEVQHDRAGLQGLRPAVRNAGALCRGHCGRTANWTSG